jgi:hypothetical protein
MVERERQRDPENCAREFDAQFMAIGSGLFFDASTVEQALDSSLSVVTTVAKNTRAAVGGDLGLVHDSSAAAAVHRHGDMHHVAELLELRPAKGAPLKLSHVCAEFASFAERHGRRLMYVDHHVLEPAREHLPKGFWLEPVEGGQAPKVDRFVTTRNLLNERKVRIPAAYRRLVQQLKEVIAKPTPGGGLQIILPRRAGAHGDLVSAFVLAAHAATHAADPNAWKAVRDLNQRIRDEHFSRWAGMPGRGF